jgi:hypothetical protein
VTTSVREIFRRLHQIIEILDALASDEFRTSFSWILLKIGVLKIAFVYESFPSLREAAEPPRRALAARMFAETRRLSLHSSNHA